MAVVFPSALAFIKERNFELYVPAYYQPNVPDEILNPTPFKRPPANPYRMTPMNRPNPMPFNPLDDPDRVQRASYPVEIILDMFRKKVQFEIANDDDIPEMFDGLDRYLLSIRADIERLNEQAIEYGRLVVSFRQELYKDYSRYMYNNPTVLDGLYLSRSKENNIINLLASLNSADPKMANLDPLRAKAIPPYDIEKIVEGQKPKEVKEMEIDAAYGLGQSLGTNHDDGKDFNLDQFLKGQ